MNDPSMFFSFGQSGIRMAVEACAVQRVIIGRPLLQLRGAPRHVEGAFHDVGGLVTAIDLGAFLGLEGAADKLGRVLLLGADERQLGLRVQEICGPRCFDAIHPPEQCSGLPRGIADCVRGVASDGTLVLDGAQLVRKLAPPQPPW
jgi:chemotaxis signal transduction protein